MRSPLRERRGRAAWRALVLAPALACASAPEPAPPALADFAPLPPAEASAAAPAPRPVVAPRTPARSNPDEPFRHDRPAGEPDRPLALPASTRLTLPGGLPVVLLTDRRLPMVHLRMLIRAGSAADPRGRAGLAELCANMLDEGTRTHSALQLAEELEQVGATLQTSASWDASTVALSVLSEHLPVAARLWADVLLSPAFHPDDLERVRANLLAQLARKKDSPTVLAGDVFHRALYGDKHPFGWPAEGTPDTLSAIDVAALRRFFADHYRPRNAVLIAAGDLDEADLRAVVAPLLQGWTGAARATPPIPAAPGPPARGGKPGSDRPRIFLTDKPAAPQSSIRVGLPGLARRDPDYHAAVVMNEILGGGFRRLTLNLRERRGWTYGVYSRFAFRRAPGPWVVSGEFIADKTADAVAEIVREIRELRDTDVPVTELAEAKASLIRAYPARFATVRSAAAQLAELAIHDLPPRELDDFQRRIGQVTVADVRRVARRVLRDEALTVAVAGDRAGNEKALRALGVVTLVDAEGRPLPAAPPAP